MSLLLLVFFLCQSICLVMTLFGLFLLCDPWAISTSSCPFVWYPQTFHSGQSHDELWCSLKWNAAAEGESTGEKWLEMQPVLLLIPQPRVIFVKCWMLFGEEMICDVLHRRQSTSDTTDCWLRRVFCCTSVGSNCETQIWRKNLWTAFLTKMALAHWVQSAYICRKTYKQRHEETGGKVLVLK